MKIHSGRRLPPSMLCTLFFVILAAPPLGATSFDFGLEPRLFFWPDDGLPLFANLKASVEFGPGGLERYGKADRYRLFVSTGALWNWERAFVPNLGLGLSIGLPDPRPWRARQFKNRLLLGAVFYYLPVTGSFYVPTRDQASPFYLALRGETDSGYLYGRTNPTASAVHMQIGFDSEDLFPRYAHLGVRYSLEVPLDALTRADSAKSISFSASLKTR